MNTGSYTISGTVTDLTTRETVELDGEYSVVVKLDGRIAEIAKRVVVTVDIDCAQHPQAVADSLQQSFPSEVEPWEPEYTVFVKDITPISAPCN